MTVGEYQYMVLSRVTGDYLPERYATREEADHARRIVRFGCRAMAVVALKGHIGIGDETSEFALGPRSEPKAFYGMDAITTALHELERAMKADPLCTIWALPGILERTDEESD